MEAVSSALSVLTAMITPAVLISASGALILSTSTRLGRVVDRVRTLSDRFEELSRSREDLELYEERRAVVFNLMDKLKGRALLLQRALTAFYLALGIFVSTSACIGLIAAVDSVRYSWMPVVLALVGASFLFYGSILLILEARLAFASLNVEMDFLWRLGKALAPAHLVEQRRPHYNPLTLRQRP